MPRGRKHTWTPEQDATLKSMWHETSANYDEIGRAVGKTGDQVRSRRAFLRMTPRRKIADMRAMRGWTREQTDILYREWEKGTGVSIIARMTGKTETQVKTKRWICSLPPRRPTGGGTKLKVAVYLDKDTIPKLDAAAKTLGMSRAAYVSKIVAREFEPRVRGWTGARGQDNVGVACLPPPALSGGQSHAPIPRLSHEGASRR